MIFSKWILDSLSSGILNSNAQYSGLHKQKFPGFRNPDYLTWDDMWNLMTRFYLVSLWPDDRTTSQAVSQDWCGQVAWFVILIPWDKLIHKAPVLTCSSVYTKRFYELWRCAALSSIFKSSFSSNAIGIVMVKCIFSFVLFLLKALLPPFSRVWVRSHFPNSFRVSPRIFYGMIDKQHQKWKEKCENEMQLDLYLHIKAVKIYIRILW